MVDQRANYQSNPGRGGYNKPVGDSMNYAKEFDTNWIARGIDENCIEYSMKFGEFLAKNRLTTSQIRNVYGELKRIQQKGFEKEKTSFLLLRPKMAYADKRNENDGLRMLKRVFDKAAVEVKTEVQYNNLVNAMEAILAYHKAFGGK